MAVKVDVKKCRDELLAKKGALEAALKKHRASFGIAERLRYKKAIAQIGAAHVILKHLDCDPPNMSFEFPPLSAAARSERMKQAKAKGAAKKRR